MPDAVPPAKYESTVSPPARPGYGADGQAAGTLGVRDEVGLQAAFIGGVGVTSEAQQTALTTARAVMDSAADFPSSGDGANPMFPQYRRNFSPVGGSLTAEYIDPRDKTLEQPDLDALRLGNAYTPTIASPGVGHGIDATALRSVTSQATQVLRNGPVALDNPTAAAHQNTDSDAQVTNVGTVRRFKLGVGSGASTAPDGGRGQFPRPRT
jgi:hypothetical protein